MTGQKYNDHTQHKNETKQLLDIYDRLSRHFGPRHWWPAETVFEMIIGAILCQNVSWKNTRTALDNLKENNLLTLEGLDKVPPETLEILIRPTRYYRIKAKKVKAFIRYVLENYEGDLEKFLSLPLPRLREELLKIYGIGEETADCIILYGSGQPIFVVDAYTKRIFYRLGMFEEKAGYREMQDFFMRRLKPSAALFNEYHALLDSLGNRICSSNKPVCGQCPLEEICRYRQP